MTQETYLDYYMFRWVTGLRPILTYKKWEESQWFEVKAQLEKKSDHLGYYKFDDIKVVDLHEILYICYGRSPASNLQAFKLHTPCATLEGCTRMK